MAVLGVEIRALHLLGRCSTKWDWQKRTEEKKKERKVVKIGEIYHIGVGTSYMKHSENCQTTLDRRKRMKKCSEVRVMST
jgi:hypothetical protein